jgi:hypothetical protein
MIPDARQQRHLIAALRLESLFDSAQLGFPTLPGDASIKRTQAETARAHENACSWRNSISHCVAATDA